MRFGVLFSQVVSEVKAKKMETMKGIKRLQVQKDGLAKKQKQAKADYDKVTSQFLLEVRRRSSGGVAFQSFRCRCPFR